MQIIKICSTPNYWHLIFKTPFFLFFAYLWSFRWPNCIVTLPRYFSFRLLYLNINTGPPSVELDKNIQRKSHFLFLSFSMKQVPVYWTRISNLNQGRSFFQISVPFYFIYPFVYFFYSLFTSLFCFWVLPGTVLSKYF
jgi:hypothetical protein